MGYTLITAPATEPVTTAEAKAHMRVDISDDDTYIGSLITAARKYAENFQNRCLITQIWTLSLPAFPHCIEFTKSPVTEINSITYIDTAGSTQTLSTSVYQLDATDGIGVVRLKYGQEWPATRSAEDYNSVVVNFDVGYADAASVPMTTKQAILMLVAHWYTLRTPVNVGNIVSSIPMSVEALLYCDAMPQ